MATATTSSYQPNRDAVIKGGLKLSGILPVGDTPTADQLADGAEFLIDGMLALQKEGIVLRTRTFEPLTLVAGTASYAAPADTLHVEEGAVVRDTNGLDAPVELLTQDGYWALSDKTLQGTPTRLFPDYTASGITLYLYQVPSAEWVTLYYPRVRRVRDLNAGNLDLDCPTSWVLGLKFFVAWMYCVRYGKSLERTEQRRIYWEGEDGTGGEKASIIAAESPKGHVQFVMPEIMVRG